MSSILRLPGRFLCFWSTERTRTTSWRAATWCGCSTRSRRSSWRWTSTRRSRSCSFVSRPEPRPLLPLPARPYGKSRWVIESRRPKDFEGGREDTYCMYVQLNQEISFLTFHCLKWQKVFYWQERPLMILFRLFFLKSLAAVTGINGPFLCVSSSVYRTCSQRTTFFC